MKHISTYIKQTITNDEIQNAVKIKSYCKTRILRATNQMVVIFGTFF
ncbi:MAG: hypothetical protein IJE68_04720 [Clostridia bacterium]|nr:hypothetical protein [Clostridia bacterium]